MQIEKRPNGGGTSIVSMVVEGSQAADAGLQRGDILCHADSNGTSEVMYDDFLALANSGQRPVVFDVRRIEIKTSKKAASSSNNNNNKSKPQSADAFARKQAVIAAAEARDKAHKAKQKPVSKSDKKQQLPVILSTADKRKQDLERTRDAQLQKQEVPRSEQARRAMEAAKQAEADLANQLGYNPYETNKSTAGQARNATVAVQHGAVGSGNNTNNSSSGAPSSLPTVAPPVDPTAPAIDNDHHHTTHDESDAMILSQHPAFEEAYTAMVTTNTSNEAVVRAFGIMRTLVKNATTKGQQTSSTVDDNDDQGGSSAKFRRVRLNNAKIKAAIVDLQGALEVMMSFGFQLTEEDGESYLVFPLGSTGPPFLPAALRQMERYEKS